MPSRVVRPCRARGRARFGDADGGRLLRGGSGRHPSRASGSNAAIARRCDGARTIAAANTVVQSVHGAQRGRGKSGTSLTVASAAALNPGGDPLAAGDLLLVVQMQGATIDTSDATVATWGEVTSLG